MSIIITLPLLFASKCNKDDSIPCRNVRYAFTVTSLFNPQKEVYYVGDSIYLTSNFPKSLLDGISNQQIDYSNSLGIGGTISFLKMDTTLKLANDAFSNFGIFNLKGSFNQIVNVPNNGINSFYLENSIYEFKIGIIFKQKGLYFINVSDLFSSGLIGKDCTNAGFNMKVTNTNKNLNLFQKAMGYEPDALLEKNIYCFRVN